jgi:hypothetical protein
MVVSEFDIRDFLKLAGLGGVVFASRLRASLRRRSNNSVFWGGHNGQQSYRYIACRATALTGFIG